MLGKAFNSISEEHWLEEVNGWIYADVLYHILITQMFYIRDSPEGMKWGELYGDKDLKESNPRLYYPDKKTLLDYFETVKDSVEKYLKSMRDEDLSSSDGFKGHLDSIHKKLVYLLRHNSHHLGELALMHRTLSLDKVAWN